MPQKPTERAPSSIQAHALPRAAAQRPALPLRAVALAASLLVPALAGAAGLPTGGQVASGSATFGQAGNTLTIQQQSPRLVTHWQGFSIGAGQTVQFVQPSAGAIALNRVLGAEVSSIQGSLKANGQVFLLNPNGVLFGAGAQVDTGGLLASTLAMSDADFLAGRLRLVGNSTAAVVNQGSLNAASGGSVALIAAQVINQGSITADRGQVLLGAGNDVTLDLGGPVALSIARGALDALVDNGGAIRADGGRVLLTAKAADQLSQAAINQTGVVRAQTLSTGEKGEILLLGDMGHGTARIGGTLDASAPRGGDGGFIETSAAYVSTEPGLRVAASSASGNGGLWLIDPYDYTINATAAANIASTLNTGTSVTVTTQANNASLGATASGSGDITVASAITKTAGGAATLTLQADRNIIVSSPITSTSGALGITLKSANNAGSALGGVAVNANLGSLGGRILIGGAGGNATSAESHGIGFALNSSASAPAVSLGSNVSISSGGGDITINGQSGVSASGTYSGTKGGVYVLSGATVDSGGGNIYVGARSTADDSVFAFGLEASSGTTTTFRTSTTTGALFVDATNSIDVLGSLGLTNNGSQARIQFWAPSVAHYLFRLNGSNQAAAFTINPPCGSSYPNCGTMVIAGGNQSYTSAGYNAVSMALQPIYVFTGTQSRVYNGSTDASDVPLTSLGGPGGFSPASLGTLGFSTASKNVASYDSLTASAANPSSYQSGTYAVAYFNQGSYGITPKTLSSFTATNKAYDGTTAAAVTSSGLVNGDNVTVNATGGFASAGVGNGISVSVTGVSLSGPDAGNYTLGGGGNISTTANITPAPLTITATDASKTYDGQAFSGGNGVSYTGFVNGETSSVLSGSLAYGGTGQGAVNAGSYSITPSGLSSGNYSISYANGALTVNPATLTYAAGSASRTYGSANPTLTGSVTGFVNGETLASATSGAAAFSTSATTASSVGSYGVTGAGLTANHGNYVFTQAVGNSTALSITPAALTVTAIDASKTYDGQAFSGGNGVSYSGFVNGETSSVLSGSLAYGGTGQGAVNAGSYSITPSGLSSSNYSISYANGALTVNPATLTYAAGSASRTYGSANPTLTGSVTGFVNGETLASATTGTAAFSTSATTASAVGSYGVTGSGLTANHGNYVFAQAAGNSSALSITPAALTVTATDASKTYDGLAFSGGNGVSYTGFVNGETSSVLSGSLAFGGTSQGAVNAGSYSVMPSGLSSGNYSISYANGALTVNPATLTYAAGSASRTYGSASPTLTGSVTGFVNGETLASATSGTAAFSTSATTASSVGSYGVTGSGLTANHGNYVFAQAAGNNSALSIAPAALTVTAIDASKTYDGHAFSGGNGVSYSGLVNGETSSVLSGSLTYAGTSQGASNAGSYSITPSGLSSGNYSISYTNGALTVNPATLTYTAGNASRAYGSANPSLTGSVTGFVNGETLASATSGAAAFSTSATTASAVGSYGVTGSGLTANHGNYVFAQAAGNSTALSITPAALTITATDASKTYDGQAFSGGNGVSYSGFVNGETSSVLSGSLAYGGTGQGAVNAGSYSITPSGLSSSNYSISYANGALTVTPATLTYAAGNASRSYGSANPSLSGSVTGFVNGETLASATSGTAAFSTSATTASSVGSYGVTGSGLTANNGNYVFAQAVGNSTALSITPAALTVTANGVSKTYDGQAFSGGNGVSYSGLVNSETSSVLSGSLAYGGSGQGAINAGSYTITPSGLSSGNYSISYANGALTVNPATLTYAAGNASRTYGSANPSLSGSVTGFVNGETLASATSGTAAFSTSATTASAVGSYGVTGSGLTANHGNYVFAQAVGNSTALSITPAALTVTAIDASKTYDGQAFSGGNGVSYTGFVNGETSSVLSGSLAYGGTSQGAVNAGSYSITPSGLSSGNYSISYTNGALTANPATLTYAAGSASRTYGSTNPTLTGSVTGFVNGETLASTTTGTTSFSTSATTASAVGSYGVTGSGLTANHGNYVFTQAAGNSTALSITPAALTITAADASKTYDGQAFSGGNGVSYSGFVNGETSSVLSGSLAYGGNSQGAVNAGSYTITPSGLGSGNYAIRFANGQLVVNPATLTYVALAASRSAGAPNPVLAGTVTGFVRGESLASATSGSLMFDSIAGSADAAGAYAITGSGLTALHGNYRFVQAPANGAALTIDAAMPSGEQYLPRVAAVPNFPDNALPTLGVQPDSLGFGALNYVSVPRAALGSPTAGTGSVTTAATGSASNVGTSGTSGTNGTNGPTPPRTARTGVAGTPVSSANGPLDVLVIDGGINLDAAPDRRR